MSTPNPAWSPDVRRRVEKSLDDVTLEAKNVLTRYTRDGFYVPPSEVAEVGDVSGLIACGETQVLNRLEARIADARVVIKEVRQELAEHLSTLNRSRPDGADESSTS